MTISPIHFLVLLLITNVCSEIAKPYCQSVTPYEGLCIENGATFIVSSNPCLSTDYVYLTILRMVSSDDDAFYYRQKFSRFEQNGTVNVIKIDDNFSVDVDIHLDEIKPYNRLHVTIRSSRTLSNGTKEDFKIFSNSYFELLPKMCKMFSEYQDKKSGVYNSYCDQSLSLGSLSSLCFKKNEASFISMLDVCTSPYTLHLFAINKDLFIHKKIIVQNETEFISLKVGNSLGSECGVVVERYYSDGFPYQHQHLKVIRMCTDTPNSKNSTLIDDVYNTAYGTMCHNNETVCDEVTPAKHSCVKSSMSTNVTLNVKCQSETYSVDFAADSILDVKNIVSSNGKVSSTYHLHANETNLLVGLKYDSYINYTVSKLLITNWYHLMIFVNSDEAKLSFPILHGNFYIDKDAKCSAHKNNKLLMYIFIPIICIMLIIAAVFVVNKLRKKRSQYGQGLPYEIEIGDDDDFDLNS